MNVSVVVPVFREAGKALAAVDALCRLHLSDQDALDILVVDDGSGDCTPERVRESLPSGAKLLSLRENRGRSGARNAGVSASKGDVVLLLDCDCIPMQSDFVLAHLVQIKRGAVASTGPVVGAGVGFWHVYQRKSSLRRSIRHWAGLSYVGSTQNLMVRRDAFEAVGGFDERYRSYGFEDRDLLIRLSKLGEVAWAKAAVVEHHDELDLVTVCRKMREGGAGASKIFSHDHPDEYRRLGYARLDARLHPGWQFLRPLLDVGLAPAIGVMEKILESSWIPFRVRAGAVRILSGLSFLRGTMDRERMD